MRRSIPATRQLAYATDRPSGGARPDAGRYHAILVGAGLLAKASCQSTSMLNVSPYSRASPLPQVVILCNRRSSVVSCGA
ncbi:hypothetical protein PSJE_18730 [Pseudomonas jessenii]|nr:hypothetical protein PSJE_18730 [Pseudomonas jessenii]